MCQQSIFYYTCNHIPMPPLTRCSRPNPCLLTEKNVIYGPTFDFPCPDCEEKAAAAERRDLGLMFGGGEGKAAGYHNTSKSADLGGDAWTVVDESGDNDDDDYRSLRGYRRHSPVMGKGKERMEKEPERHWEKSRRRVIVEDSEDEPWLQTVKKPVLKEDVKMKGALVVRPKTNGASTGAQDAVSRFEEEEVRRRENLRGQSMGRDAVMGRNHASTGGNFAGRGGGIQQPHSPVPKPRTEEKREPPVHHHHPVKKYHHPPPTHIPSSPTSPPSPLSPLSPAMPQTRRPTPTTDNLSLTRFYHQPSSSHRPATPSPCQTCRYQVLRYSCNHDTTFRPQNCGKDCKNVIQSPDLEVSMACPNCVQAAENTASTRRNQTQHHQHPFHHQSHRAATAHHTSHTGHKSSLQGAYNTPSYFSASCPHSACFSSDDDYDYDLSCSSEEEGIIIPAIPASSAATRSHFIHPTTSLCHPSFASSAIYCASPTPRFVPTVRPCFVPTAARPVELQVAESIVFARVDRRGGGGGEGVYRVVSVGEWFAGGLGRRGWWR